MTGIAGDLDPRSLLVIGGGPELDDLRARHLTVFLRSGPLDADRRRVRRFDGDLASFFDPGTSSEVLTPWRWAPGAFCDIAVIGDELSGQDIDVLADKLSTVLLTSTVLVLTGGRRALAERLMVARGGGSLMRVRRSGADVLLVGGIEGLPREPPDEWLAKHRLIDPPLALALTPVPGTPDEPSRRVEPVYREIGGARELMRTKRQGVTSMRRWWGKSLELLPANISCGDLVFQRSNGLSGAVLVTANGGVHDASFVWRRGFGPEAVAEARTTGATFLRDGARRPPIAEAAKLPVARMVGEPLLLLGFVEPRFGHLITETFNRGWAIPWALAQGMRVLVWTEGDWTALQMNALALFGLTPDRIEIAQPGTRYRALHVPSDGFRLWSSVGPLMADLWQRAAAKACAEAAPPAGGDPKRVYLSRRRVARRPLENEEALEALLRADGFACVAPETLKLQEQVRLVAEAEMLIGCFGSGMHLSAFARPGTERLVIAPEHHLGPEDILFSVANRSVVSFHVEPQLRTSREAVTKGPWRIDMARFEKGYARWLSEAEARRAAQPSAEVSVARSL